MTSVTCPKCKRMVNFDSKEVRKEFSRYEAIVKCPHCGCNFIVQLVGIKRYYLKSEEAKQEIKLRG
jgi:hypothetical protein